MSAMLLQQAAPAYWEGGGAVVALALYILVVNGTMRFWGGR